MFKEKVLQNTSNCTIDKKSREYMLQCPNMRSNTLSIIFT